ncbi:MAG: lipopolysaccharide biosynthesis protein [Ilumatobacteraceae bacterium]
MDPSDDQRSSRLALPEGTLPVGIGLLIAGITAYLFLKVAKVALGSDQAVQPIASLWIATFALAPGFFLPLEQELARTLAHRRALGQGGKPVVARVRSLGIGLAVLVTVAALAASPLIVSGYFDGDWILLIALIMAFAAYAPAHLSRGIASGNGRFNAYAIVMGADGAVRIVLCAALAIFGVKTVGLYGFAVAVSPLPGVLWVKAKGALRTEPGPPASWAEVTPNLGWLLLGSVFAAALVNAGPLAATLLANDNQKDLVTRFTYGVLLARIQLFLFQAVQAALLPRLSRLAARNEIAEFRAGFAKLMKLVLLVGVVGTAGAFLLGPLVIERFYNATLSRRTMAMLALGSACYMVALAIAQAVIALRGHALVALGWAMAAVTFVVVTWLSSDDLFRRVELGLVASSFAALCVFSLALRSRLRSGDVPSGQSVMEAVNNLPLET